MIDISEIKRLLEPKTVGALMQFLSHYPDDALVSFIAPSNSDNEIDDNCWMASISDTSKTNEFSVEGKVTAIEIPLKWDKDEGPYDSCDYDREPQTSF